MEFRISRNPGEVQRLRQPVYLTAPYLTSQEYENFYAFHTENIILPTEIQEKTAVSIPRSPFGSAYAKDSKAANWDHFLESTLESLRSLSVNRLEIKHPSTIYESFVPGEKLVEKGLSISYCDINQHIALLPNWKDSIHEMQQRKLQKLQSNGFEFRKMDETELKVAHDFIQVCRQTQGLPINISWAKLQTLSTQIPEAYTCFGVFRAGKISAVCIVVEVTPQIAYYYLPATSPLFRSESPMVLLIAGLVEYYRKKGFKYLDLGVSSIEGRPQETLRIFKERMGAKESKKPTYEITW